MRSPHHPILTAGLALLLIGGAGTRAAADPGDGSENGSSAGGVRGRVIDSEKGTPMAGVSVEVLDRAEKQTVTDGDGNYRIDLPPGRYKLRVFFPLYEGKRVTNLVITPNTLVRLDIRLEMSSDAIEEVVVLAEPERQTEKGVLEIRKRESTVSDALSAQEISRTPDASASDAVKRVVSASVVDGRYVYIRGLGDRYVTTLLNGVTLPSPEPDRQAVPLDLFPTSLLANLTIAKSYSAQNPGSFAGGTLLIETNTYPKDFTLRLKASTSANSVVTGSAQNAYSGGSLDFLGFDDGTRALPAAVPRDRRLSTTAGFDQQTMENIGESFPNVWAVEQHDAYPNLSLGASVGDTLRPGGKRLGYLATLNYGHKLSVREADVANPKLESDGTVAYRERRKSVRGAREAQVGGLAAVGYQLHRDHEIDLFTLYSHTGAATAQTLRGESEVDDGIIDASRLSFEERALSFTQLQTRHRFPDAHNLELKLQGNVSFTSAEEPDTRDLVYEVFPDGRERFRPRPGSGERFFSKLDETSMGGGVDTMLPLLARLRLTTGASAQNSERTFSARRFRYEHLRDAPLEPLFDPPETIFGPQNVGEVYRLQESTRSSDGYKGALLVLAGYGVTEIQATEALRFTTGLRFEYSDQSLSAGSKFAPGNEMLAGSARSDSDLLPSVSAVYALTDEMNLRAAYAYTLSRPRFRELAPFLYFDYARGTNVTGNPALTSARIHNGDLRWEWFAGDLDLFAASLFYKRFEDPIEQIVYPSGDLSYANAAQATAYGAELEARTSLARVHRSLEDVRAWANLSLIQSQVELSTAQMAAQTNAKRALQGQSPYVVNMGVGYARSESGTDVNLLYNLFGRRIAEVGFEGLPDVYEEPFHRLDAAAGQDLTYDLKLKLAVTNLLNQRVTMRQGELEVLRFHPGVGVSLSLEWSP